MIAYQKSIVSFFLF